MNFKSRHDSGFTLIEVIVSIAILSVVSVVALQLFMTAQTVNTRSRQGDMATIFCTNNIEILKMFTTTEAYLEGFEVEATDTGFVGTMMVDRYIETKDYESGSDHFKYTLTLTADPETLGLYDVQTTVTDLLDGRVLADYTTKHYFREEVASREQ